MMGSPLTDHTGLLGQNRLGVGSTWVVRLLTSIVLVYMVGVNPYSPSFVASGE